MRRTKADRLMRFEKPVCVFTDRHIAPRSGWLGAWLPGIRVARTFGIWSGGAVCHRLCARSVGVLERTPFGSPF
jgi:hypothetical protein